MHPKIYDKPLILLLRESSGSETGESSPLHFQNPSYHTEEVTVGQEIAMSEHEMQLAGNDTVALQQ